jgi:hypothetical protein
MVKAIDGSEKTNSMKSSYVRGEHGANNREERKQNEDKNEPRGMMAAGLRVGND